MFSENPQVIQQAIKHLEVYFDAIVQGTFNDLVTLQRNSNYGKVTLKILSDIISTPNQQTIRDTRHNIHCKDQHGVTEYMFEEKSNNINSISCCGKKGQSSENIVNKIQYKCYKITVQYKS